MSNSKFQFQGFNIKRSLIERQNGNPTNKLSINFSPKGNVFVKDKLFQLFLGVEISDEEKILLIEIEAVADFKFEDDIEKDMLENYFFINAPALLFPYIRAYISTITNLSGVKPVTLPTLDITELGENLRKNTQVVEEE